MYLKPLRYFKSQDIGSVTNIFPRKKTHPEKPNLSTQSTLKYKKLKVANLIYMDRY